MSTPTRPVASPGWRIGRLGGTPVYLARSWPLIVVLLFAIVAPSLLGNGRSTGYAIFVAAAAAVMLLVSVLVHEASHALAARQRGHVVDRIVADVWGGHTVYDSRGVTPLTTAYVAAVGPVSNLVLALLAWLVQPLVQSDLASGLLGAMTYANLFVGLFNLLPGLPLDGGQIVSSLVWRATGRKGTGLSAAGWLGRAVAAGSVVWFVGLPLARGEQPSTISFIWAGMIAFFLWRGASAAIRSGQIHDATAGPAAAVLEPVTLVSGAASLADLDELLSRHGVRALAVEPGAASGATGSTAPGGPVATGGSGWVAATDPTGWPLGLLDPSAVASVPPSARAGARVAGAVLAQAPDWVVPLPPDAVLTDLVQAMSERALSVAVVVDEQDRRVLGLATASRINDVVGAELARRKGR